MKLAVIYDDGMPFEGIRPDRNQLMALPDADVELLQGDQCANRLAECRYDAIMNLHGTYLPKSAWVPLLAQLQAGAGYVHLGNGAPNSRPVSKHGEGSWSAETLQTAYHSRLGIRECMPVPVDDTFSYDIHADIPLLEGYEACFTPKPTMGFVVQFTSKKDIPAELGSSGPMDAAIFPLLRAYDADGRYAAAPVVLIEHDKGEFAGGRWIFINQEADGGFWNNGGAALLSRASGYAANGRTSIRIRSLFACYKGAESPTLDLKGESCRRGGEPVEAAIHVTVQGNRGIVFEQELKMVLKAGGVTSSLPLNTALDKGLYEICAKVSAAGDGIERCYRNGFWIYDEELMRSGSPLEAGRDYFRRGGKPYPIVGMTYMQSDVHRKYPYMPNAYLWNRDMAEMKQAGINMLRTGIWTGQRQWMFVDGEPSEQLLRSLDGWLLTAVKHDLPVTFTFFTFTPEMWEGQNPYLDPRSIQAQKRFIRSIVSRYADCPIVNWDLINEPSFSNPKRLWQAVPNRDSYETAAWRKWLKERHGDIAVLQERWNCTPDELPGFGEAALPAEADFNRQPEYAEPFKGLKLHDYMLFSQRMFIEWAKDMTNAIRDCGAQQLVTAGQDEALNAKKPSPLFYREAVDYTTNHSWWLMDDLYWDSIICKSPDKPNLIQETGIMYVQRPDGGARRSETELRDILERKYALAFAGNNAGAVQWIWNSNIYMDSLNEANIGALRGDGSHKPESAVSYHFGAFMRAAAGLFTERRQDAIAVVYPFANDFSVRDGAVEATQRLTRVLGYELNYTYQVYSEYHLDELQEDKKLILVPSPGSMTEALWEKLLQAAQNGAHVCLTGSAGLDEYFKFRRHRSESLSLPAVPATVSREEELRIGHDSYRCVFGGNRIAWVNKDVVQGEEGIPARLHHIAVGQGYIHWCPLPLELNTNHEAIRALYEQVLSAAGLTPDFHWLTGNWSGLLGRRLRFPSGSLYVFVSESGQDTPCRIVNNEGMTYTFTVPANRALLFATDSAGDVTITYRGLEVEARPQSIR